MKIKTVNAQSEILLINGNKKQYSITHLSLSWEINHSEW